METLYRWSRFVEESQLEEWETRLLVEDIVYSAEKQTRRKRWQLSAYFSSRDHAEALRSRFGGGVTRVQPQDWQPSAEVGARSLLRIRDALIVIEAEDEAVWASVQQEHPERIVLSFPPQLAFGTGGHPTTAGCLRFLVDAAREREGTRWSLLDLGCGSGILAIAAAKLGARGIVAVEMDEVALKYARTNAERHGVADRIEFRGDDAVELVADRSAGRFDVVAGNLFSSLLTALMPNLPNVLEPGGEGILSGFLTSQTREIDLSAKAAGLPLRDFLRRGKWVAARTCHHGMTSDSKRVGV